MYKYLLTVLKYSVKLFLSDIRDNEVEIFQIDLVSVARVDNWGM